MELLTQALSANAPGCFGSPTVFAQDSQVCQGCPVFDTCGTACIETLKQIRDRINVDDILAKHRQARTAYVEQAKPPHSVPKIDISKFLPPAKLPTEKVEPVSTPPSKESPKDVTPEHQATLDGLKEKARNLASKWCRDGVIDKLHSDLLQGINTFASQARQNFESVTCELLINGAVTKHDLVKAFMARLGAKKPWTKGSAESHANFIIQALQGFGIITATDNGYVVTPKNTNENA
jgi:hypothetical protein